MPTAAECVCCCEEEKIVDKLQESDLETACITDHEGFDAVCRNVWVFQAAYSTDNAMVLTMYTVTHYMSKTVFYVCL